MAYLLLNLIQQLFLLCTTQVLCQVGLTREPERGGVSTHEIAEGNREYGLAFVGECLAERVVGIEPLETFLQRTGGFDAFHLLQMMIIRAV